MRLLKLLCVAMFCLSGAVWAVDTDKDTLPDDWELAHGRNPNVADYTINNRYVGEYQLCAKDDAGTRCWNYAGTLLAITSFVSSSYVRPALRSGYCGDYSSSMGDCSGNNLPQYASTSSCNRYPNFVACETQCTGMIHTYQYIPVYQCINHSFSTYPPSTGDPGIWICQLDLANGFQCYAVTSSGLQTGAPLNVPMTFHIDSDGDGFTRPADPDDLNSLKTPDDMDGDGILNNADWDDDNDGVPDTVDAEPLNSGNVSEITLPLDSHYKGLQLKGAHDAAP